MIVDHHLDHLQGAVLTKRRWHGDDLTKLVVGRWVGVGGRSVLIVDDVVHQDIAIKAVDSVRREGDAKVPRVLNGFLPRHGQLGARLKVGSQHRVCGWLVRAARRGLFRRAGASRDETGSWLDPGVPAGDTTYKCGH